MTVHDVVVVGAGPAGLAAAVSSLAAGLRVALVERGTGLGGQYWRQPSPPSAAHGPGGASGVGGLGAVDLADLHHGLDTFTALRERVGEGVRSGQLRLLLRTQVWTAVRTAGLVTLSTAGTGPGAVAGELTAHRVVLATGAHDVALPFPGWELPGVMTVGGVQALLKGGGVVAGKRVVVAGSGPFMLPVAVGLARRGATVVGVHEASSPVRWAHHLPAVVRNLDRVREGLDYAAGLARHRVPVHHRSMVVAAHGRDEVEAVTVQALDAAGALVVGSERVVEADTVGVGWGFAPVLDLAVTLGCAVHPGSDGRLVVTVDDRQRTTVPEVLVAGEMGGVGGAALALVEGEAAAASVVDDLPGPLVPLSSVAVARRRALRSRASAQRAFAAALLDAHPVPSGWSVALTPETLLCRCEEVAVGTVRDAMAHGVGTARELRQLTRVGMGWCQGRTCEAACTLLLAAAPGGGARPSPPMERLVAQPVPLGVLASSWVAADPEAAAAGAADPEGSDPPVGGPGGPTDGSVPPGSVPDGAV